ncbi:MAG: PilZ domain-containing protein [Nitrospirae bacterium]|nr:PilZ domain-containing protein [Nitrospirota bacterium]MBI5056360.1 PilZ domain-containing protein [Nitrospirota bacterium]
MERRTVERLPAKLPARLFYGTIVYTGTVANLSENGMFICTKVQFPVDSMFIVVVLQDGQTFKLPIRVKRVAKPSADHACIEENGIGVELVNPPQDYLEFVSKCKSAPDIRMFH